MKKIFLLISGLLVICLFVLVTIKVMKKDDNKDMTKIRVAEVTHSMFYAPWYVAIENGYFEEEGLEIELILTPGADKVSAAVLSNDVEIGFCGPESSIYVYNGNEKDYIQTFAGLTKRDGQFIVGRKNVEDFSLDDLKGKEILVGRTGGMPALNFLNALQNTNTSADGIDINYAIDFAALSGAFISGTGDFVNLFEPNATQLEKQGFGYIVGSVGMLSGEMPYTAFNARKSYIEEHGDVIEKFNRAINKGLEYVKTHSSEEIANVILAQFPDSSLNDAITIIERYKEADSWLDTAFISEESFKNLEDIMIRADLLEEYVPYNDLINNMYSE